MIAAGIDGFTPDIMTVSRLLGHTNLTTTNKYLYKLQESMKSAVGVLDKMENLSPKISPETQEKGLARKLTPRNFWWAQAIERIMQQVNIVYKVKKRYFEIPP